VTCLHGGGLLLPPPSSATSQTWRRIYTTVKHQHQHQHSSSFSSSPTSLWGDELVQLRDELKTRCHPTWRDCLRTGPSDPRVIKLVRTSGEPSINRKRKKLILLHFKIRCRVRCLKSCRTGSSRSKTCAKLSTNAFVMPPRFVTSKKQQLLSLSRV
jgi:hypothetical protein